MKINSFEAIFLFAVFCALQSSNLVHCQRRVANQEISRESRGNKSTEGEDEHIRNVHIEQLARAK